MLNCQIITLEGKLEASLIINSSQFSDRENTIEEPFHNTAIQLLKDKQAARNLRVDEIK